MPDLNLSVADVKETKKDNRKLNTTKNTWTKVDSLPKDSFRVLLLRFKPIFTGESHAHNRMWVLRASEHVPLLVPLEDLKMYLRI